MTWGPRAAEGSEASGGRNRRHIWGHMGHKKMGFALLCSFACPWAGILRWEEKRGLENSCTEDKTAHLTSCIQASRPMPMWFFLLPCPSPLLCSSQLSYPLGLIAGIIAAPKLSQSAHALFHPRPVIVALHYDLNIAFVPPSGPASQGDGPASCVTALPGLVLLHGPTLPKWLGGCIWLGVQLEPPRAPHSQEGGTQD